MNLSKGLSYQFLSPDERSAYGITLECFGRLEKSFSFSHENLNIDPMKIIQAVLGDNPTVFYFKKNYIEIIKSETTQTISLSDVIEKPEAQKMIQQVEAEASKIVAMIKASVHKKNDPYTVLLKLYEYFQDNIQYGRENVHKSTDINIDYALEHTAYGALIYKNAVCDGIASAFNLLASKLGFRCMLAVGRSAYELSTTKNHAWTIIEIANSFYHMDVTWDICHSSDFGEYSYSYFALSDFEIENDHSWDRKVLPSCIDNSFSYHRKNDCYAENIQQASHIIQSAKKKVQGETHLKLSNKLKLDINLGEKLAELYLEVMSEVYQEVRMKYIWEEHTRCFYAKLV